MNITIHNRRPEYAGVWGFAAQVLVMSLAVVIAALLLPGVTVGSLPAVVLTAAVIALLNNFLRPVLIMLTLPLTAVTLGLFIFVINAVIVLIASAVVPSFGVDGFGWALLFSLLLTVLNYLLELPNRWLGRKQFEEPDDDPDRFDEFEEIK
ncbi:MAG: phage holin family protein [Bacteroidales bacterium]|nr:phage holin family protein [Bacteroidales bacterium]